MFITTSLTSGTSGTPLTVHILLDFCPSGPNFDVVNGHCYYFEETALDYADAEANCRNVFGGRGKLFEPINKNSNDEVGAAFEAVHKDWSYWIGVNDLLKEGAFQYGSGGDLVFTNWDTGEFLTAIFSSRS